MPHENQEIKAEYINWADEFVINMEHNSTNPVELFNSILDKARLTSLYVYGTKIKNICDIIDPEQNVVR